MTTPTHDALAVQDIPNLLDQLRREKFFGRIAFDLRAGEIALVRTERTQLVTTNPSTSHPRENRDDHHAKLQR